MRAHNFKNEIGNKYGTLTVVRYIGKIGSNGHSTWECLCECGGSHVATGTTLREGKCLHCPACRPLYVSERKTIHGCSYSDTFKGTDAYRSWVAMKARCYNVGDTNYKNYGGRGITVCDRWLEPDGKGFLNFLEDVGERPDGMSLDRVDVNGNYCKENCKWSTRQEQANNKRNNRKFPYNGELLTLREIAALLGLSYNSVYNTLVTKGASVDMYISSKLKESV